MKNKERITSYRHIAKIAAEIRGEELMYDNIYPLSAIMKKRDIRADFLTWFKVARAIYGCRRYYIRNGRYYEIDRELWRTNGN